MINVLAGVDAAASYARMDRQPGMGKVTLFFSSFSIPFIPQILLDVCLKMPRVEGNSEPLFFTSPGTFAV